MNINKKGFTLVELSIVIVLIGLIVGGIVGGQAIVRQANIRAEISQLQEFQVAYNSFYLEYNGIPGDLPNADDYWPSTNGGSGNGMIENADSTFDMAQGNYGGELSRVFEHLSLSGLIDQQFDTSHDLNVGFPSSKIDKTVGILMGSEYSPSGGGLTNCENQRRNNLVLAIAFARPSALPNLGQADNGSVLNPKDVSSVDNKVDDNNAVGGKLLALNSGGAATGRCHNNGAYRLDREDGCRYCFYLR